ncbi:hypothetical protein BX285_2090 [Streptomyces sp. 1114.5]|uniref:WXG100 family type VII secretion target n=1 Tax=Streptomyces sp. 1114.5 TaxID=1938830 RepID=UPI000F258664|nr:hypothetical protein [Streptomyces sp. 1114.5]RKT17703.1 hypothetical protein BX285_2090 [Streptomyces sp. 1114.5]
MVYTDFTKYSHAQLRTMAQALDPGAVMAAGDPWRNAADTLKQIRLALTKASTEAATTWEGATSNAFHTRMLNLAASINNAAAYANDAANILHNVSEAMAKAKHDMPEEPGNWDSFKDHVADGVSSLFGDGDDHIPIANRKKAEAAAIMQTLAMHYRIATPALKAPPPYRPGGKEDSRDVTAQEDPGAAAAVAAAVMSGTSLGAGGTSARTTGGTAPQRPKSFQPPSAAGSTSRSVSAPTDSGIKGGTAQAPPKPSATVGRGPDAGISGTPVSRPGGIVPSPPTSGTQTSALTGAPTPSPVGAPVSGGGGQTTISPGGPTAQSPSALPGFGQSKTGFGDKGFSGREITVEGPSPRGGRGVSTGGGGEVPPGIGGGGRGMSGAKQTGNAPARSGGVVGGPAKPGAGARGKEAFTEGGSGLGTRARLTGEPGATGTSGMAPGGALGGAQGRKKDRGKSGRRPDYLVEDEETWASDKPTNPNVVK